MKWESIILQIYDQLIITKKDGVVYKVDGRDRNIFKKNVSYRTIRELEEQHFTESIYDKINDREERQQFHQTTWTGVDLLTTVFKEENYYTFAYTYLNSPYVQKGPALTNQELSSFPFVINSRAMEDVAMKLKKTSEMGATALLLGESGVGKDMAARAIHQIGPRRDKPFISVNCGAIPENLIESELFGFVDGAFTGAKKGGIEGKFRQAHTGILFLDEIGELSLTLQVKLLRALQDRIITPIGGEVSYPVDIQVITATNRPLEELVVKGEFRADLYYRLNIIPIHIPPLRDRAEEIPALVYHFTKKYNERYQQEVEFSPEAIDYLCIQPWLGNVRELENMIERLIVLSNVKIITCPIIAEFIPVKAIEKGKGPIIDHLIPLQEAVEIVEEELITMAMNQYKSIKLASNVLGISQPTMSRKYKKIRELQLQGKVPLDKRSILEEQLNKRLSSIAIVTAVTIPLEEVKIAMEDTTNAKSREQLERKLTAIYQQEGDIMWVFIFQMQKDGKVNHVASCNDFVIKPGEEYVGPPEMMKVVYEAFKGKVGVTPVYEDKYGEWKTCFAPLYDEAGTIIAIVGYDYSKSYVNNELQRLSKQLNLTI